ncbi:helix-hairpin-helix domain-containing protein [Achromobacter sp. UMC71]|uniref:ComEA family DNA-binding protein n=1 Tax=Achromobacter sp. UMC71 TaxID=1862320 RepID=UPI0016042680|nr:helix-hairpin-helix domain-containing protein [Achromobacter sp. UMC71]MBB1625495.1 hypothetical protein [Achromobacter sp. UMC71]
MNPFLHSTLAGHLSAAPWRRLRRQAATRGGRRAWRQALGVALLAAGMAHAPAQALDVNGATTQQLEGIRGIGPRTAETIVRERDRAGKFDSLQDLAERVRGISQKKAEALEAAGLTVGAGGSAPKAGPAPSGGTGAAGTKAAAPAQGDAKAAVPGAGAAKAGASRQASKPASTARPRP